MRPEKNLAHPILSQYFDHLFVQEVSFEYVLYIKQWGDGVTKIESLNPQCLRGQQRRQKTLQNP